MASRIRAIGLFEAQIKMNTRLSIQMIFAIAVLLGAPAVVESSEPFQLRQSLSVQPVKFPVNTAPQRLNSKKGLGKKFVLILNLSDQQINNLRVTGFLNTPVPPKYVNRVGAIRIKKTFSFQSEPLKVRHAKTSKRDRLVTVEVDNTVLERLAYQPVDMQVYESGYNRVQLRFNPRGVVAGELPEEFEPAADQDQNPYMYVRINSKRGVYGWLKDFETLPVKTQFGQVDVPSNEIAGIRFNSGEDNQALIVLKKGDAFSGQIELDSIKIRSRWGDKEFKLSELESLTLNREIVFLRDAINPKRWRLQSTLPATAVVPNSVVTPNYNSQVLPNSNLVNPLLPNQAPIQAPSVLYPEQPVPFGFPN